MSRARELLRKAARIKGERTKTPARSAAAERRLAMASPKARELIEKVRPSQPKKQASDKTKRLLKKVREMKGEMSLAQRWAKYHRGTVITDHLAGFALGSGRSKRVSHPGDVPHILTIRERPSYASYEYPWYRKKDGTPFSHDRAKKNDPNPVTNRGQFERVDRVAGDVTTLHPGWDPKISTIRADFVLALEAEAELIRLGGTPTLRRAMHPKKFDGQLADSYSVTVFVGDDEVRSVYVLDFEKDETTGRLHWNPEGTGSALLGYREERGTEEIDPHWADSWSGSPQKTWASHVKAYGEGKRSLGRWRGPSAEDWRERGEAGWSYSRLDATPEVDPEDAGGNRGSREGPQLPAAGPGTPEGRPHSATPPVRGLPMSRARELLAKVEQLKMFQAPAKVDVIELFAGAGGAGLGLHRAGFGPALMVEYNATAADTLRAAVREGMLEGAVIESDVRKVNYRPYKGVRLLWASWPCQPFSTAGKGAGAWDERNGWPWTLKAIDEAQPVFFAGENVTGLLRHRSGCKKRSNPRDCAGCYTERVILADLLERFKWADKWVLNAADYGVPQIRNRVFFVAGPHPVLRPRSTHANPYPEERKPGETTEAAKLREEARLNSWERPGVERWVTMDEVLDYDPWDKIEPMYSGYPESHLQDTPHHRQLRQYGPDDYYCTHCAVAISTGICACPFPSDAEEALDRPAPTIAGGTQRGHVGGGSVLSATMRIRDELHWALKRYDPTKGHADYDRMRQAGGWDQATKTTYLGVSVDEVKRLMGFPADWPLAGSNQRKYRQLGNAVVPAVAQAVGEAIRNSETLFGRKR